MIERADLLGAWELVEWTMQVDGEERGHPFGPDATGRLIYAQDHMAAVLSRRGRPRFGTRLAAQAPVDQRAEAMSGYVSYSGPWDLHGDRVVHHVEVSLFPDWEGVDLVRFAHLEDGRLVLTSEAEATGAGDVVHRLVWERSGTAPSPGTKVQG